MHNYSTTLNKFFDILYSDTTDSYLKCTLVNSISCMISQHYSEIEKENYMEKQENENIKYVNYLNIEYDRLSSEINELKEQIDNFNDIESCIDERLINEINKKKELRETKLNEIEQLNELLSDENYPIWKKQQDEKEKVEDRLGSLERYQKLFRETIEEHDDSIKVFDTTLQNQCSMLDKIYKDKNKEKIDTKYLTRTPPDPSNLPLPSFNRYSQTPHTTPTETHSNINSEVNSLPTIPPSLIDPNYSWYNYSSQEN